MPGEKMDYIRRQIFDGLKTNPDLLGEAESFDHEFDSIEDMKGSFQKGANFFPVVNSKRFENLTINKEKPKSGNRTLLLHFNANVTEGNLKEDIESMITSKIEDLNLGQKTKKIMDIHVYEENENKHLLKEIEDISYDKVYIFDHNKGATDKNILIDILDLKLSKEITLGDLLKKITGDNKIGILGIFSDIVQYSLMETNYLLDIYNTELMNYSHVHLFSTSISPTSHDNEFEFAGVIEILIQMFDSGEKEVINWIDSSQRLICERLRRGESDHPGFHENASSIFISCASSSFAQIVKNNPEPKIYFKDTLPITGIESLDLIMGNIGDGDAEECDKILAGIKELVFNSLSVINTLYNFEEYTNCRTFFLATLFSMNPKIRLQQENSPDPLDLYKQFLSYEKENNKVKIIGKQTINTQTKMATEGEILEGFHCALGRIGRRNSSIEKILTKFEVDVDKHVEHYKKLEKFICDSGDRVLPVNIHKREHAYPLLNPVIAKSLRKIHKLCKDITHGYQYVERRTEYDILFQNQRITRSLNKVELREQLQLIENEISNNIGKIEKSSSDHSGANLQEVNIDWWEKQVNNQ